MENINKDKLYNFLIHAGILFLLFIIIYLMYIDFVNEKISNNKIYQSNFKEKFDTLISSSNFDNTQNIKYINNEKEIEHFQPIDPDLKYIIKRNYNTINNATCLASDVSNNNTCYMKPSNFYPSQSYINTSIIIKSLPDSIYDKTINKSTFYTSVTLKDKELKYNNWYTTGSGLEDPIINLGYKSNYFNFSNYSGNRMFNINNILELQILNYIYRYRYNKILISDEELKLKEINNILPYLITDKLKFDELESVKKEEIYESNKNIIKNLQDMILLKSGFNNHFIIPNIYEIKELLIKYFEPFFNNPVFSKVNLIINDKSKLTILIDPKTNSDDISNISIYSMIFNIDITIQLINLRPVLSQGVDDTMLENLQYLDRLDSDDKNYNYTFQKEISFPIALPFNLPNIISPSNTSNISADVSDTKWYDNIKIYMTTLFIDNQLQQRNKIPIKSGIDAVSTIMSSIDPIKNDIHSLSNIKDIFALYVPDNDKFDNITGKFYYIMTMKSNTLIGQNIVFVLLFDNSYNPNFCLDNNSKLYNKKCLPSCPSNYGIDLGLVCLKSDITDFIPESDFCSQLKQYNITGRKNTILMGLLDACNIDNINNIANETLFNIKDIKGIKKISGNNYILNQAINDITILPERPEDEIIDNSTDSLSFNNVNKDVINNPVIESKQHFGNVNVGEYQRIEHFSPFLN